MTGSRWALAGLSLSMLMSSLDTSIANAGLPVMAAAFSASFAAVQWIVLAYLLAITTVIVSAGRLGDLLGRRRVLLAGIALFTGASALCGLAPSLGLLIAARALQGLGAAVMMSLTMALVSETVMAAETGRAMGLLGTMSAIGTTLGPSLGGLLMSGFGWPAIFLVNVPLGILNFVLAYRFLPAGTGARVRFDFAGMTVLAVTLGAYALAMTRGLWWLLVLAGAGVVVFLRVEARAAAPLVRLALLRERVLGAGFAMSALVSTVILSTMVVGPFYLSRTLGLGTVMVGVVLSAGPLAAALAGVPAGRLVDRFGAGRMTLGGLAGMALGCFVLAVVPVSFGVLGYVGPIVCVTTSYALFQVANNTSVMRGIGVGERGVVSGMLSLSRNLGLISGASAMGAVFAAWGGPVTFAVAVVLVVGALGIAGVRARGVA